MDQIKNLLKQGEDWLFRFHATVALYAIIKQSENGEIGWGGFIEQIREVANEMERIGKDNWKGS